MYRAVDYEVLLNNFASDRSHMMQKGKFMSPCPKYDCIKNIFDQKMNLFEFLDVNKKEEFFGNNFMD